MCTGCISRAVVAGVRCVSSACASRAGVGQGEPVRARGESKALSAWSSSGGVRELCWGHGGHSPAPSGCPLSLERRRRATGLGTGRAGGCPVFRVGAAPPRARGWWVPTAATPLRQWELPTQPLPRSFLFQHLLQLPDLCFSLTKSRNSVAQPHLPQQLSCPLVPSMWGTISSSLRPTLAPSRTSAPVVRLSLGRDGVCRVSAPQDKQHDPNAPILKMGHSKMLLYLARHLC